MVDTTSKGKLIVFITPSKEKTADTFKVGISNESLKKLRERSQRKIFEWTIKDSPLVIRGKGN